MQILGITGRSGSGKDFLADLLVRHLGFTKWSFALTLKAMARGYGFTAEELATKPPHVRTWLQEYGTEQHRDAVHPDFWLRVTDFWLEKLADLGHVKVVFPDCRFANEVRWVQDRGGIVVRLTQGDRPYPLAGTPAADHPSEQVEDLAVDVEILNDLTAGPLALLQPLYRAGGLSLDQWLTVLHKEVP